MEELLEHDQNSWLLTHLLGIEKILGISYSLSRSLHMSALLHMKPTLITHLQNSERNTTFTDFYCTALLFLRHELLGSDYPVLTLRWLISSSVMAQNITKLSCQRAFENKYIRSQMIVLYHHLREQH